MSFMIPRSFLSIRPGSRFSDLLFKRSHNSSTRSPKLNIQWQKAAQHMDPKQASFYHSEMLIKVNENDEVLGPITKGESHAIETVQKSIYHRALSLLIFDEQERFLLTQRAECKITFPGYFTNACCSHPLFNDTELEEDGNALGARRATIRRSNFELGTELDAFKPDELTLVNKLAYRAESDGGLWGEAEIDYIFVIKKELKLRLNPDEVQSYRYVTKSQMRDLLVNHNKYDVKVTPWVRLLARDFLFKYWDNLENLEHIAQPETIIRNDEMFRAY